MTLLTLLHWKCSKLHVFNGKATAIFQCIGQPVFLYLFFSNTDVGILHGYRSKVAALCGIGFQCFQLHMVTDAVTRYPPDSLSHIWVLYLYFVCLHMNFKLCTKCVCCVVDCVGNAFNHTYPFITSTSTSTPRHRHASNIKYQHIYKGKKSCTIYFVIYLCNMIFQRKTMYSVDTCCSSLLKMVSKKKIASLIYWWHNNYILSTDQYWPWTSRMDLHSSAKAISIPTDQSWSHT